MSISINYGQLLKDVMRLYKVEIASTALVDIDALSDFLVSVMSVNAAWHYVQAMKQELLSLSVYADFYHPSQYSDIRSYHPRACRMVSHNKKWVYIFHIEDNTVVVDRILPSKMITK